MLQTTFAEVLVKTYRWLTLVAALLITLGEVLVFNSQATSGPQEQGSDAAPTGGAADTHPSLAGIASLYWAAADARTPERVR
jgi:hypothetical protein